MIMDVDKASGPGPALEQVEMCRDRGDYLIGVGGDGEKQVSTIVRCSLRSTWPPVRPAPDVARR